MADFQAKSSRGAKNEKYWAILDLAKISHQDNFECGESIKNSPEWLIFKVRAPEEPKSKKNVAVLDLAKILHQNLF